MTDASLSDAIENLSSKKKHVVSDEALRAKEEYMAVKHEFQNQYDSSKKFNKKLSVIEEFNYSVTLLISIFEKTNFDELALFIAHPTRVLVLNFCIGILRGMGFAIGLLVVVAVLVYFFGVWMSPAAYHFLIAFLQTLVQS